VSSYVSTLKTWHYLHLLLHAVLWPHAATAPTVQQSIDISYPLGPQQQTHHMQRQQAHGQMDGHRTVAQILLSILYQQCQQSKLRHSVSLLCSFTFRTKAITDTDNRKSAELAPHFSRQIRACRQ